MGFQGDSVVKNRLPMQKKHEMQVWSLGQEDPLEEEMATRFSIGKSYGQRSLVDYSPWCHKELDMTERLSPICINNKKTMEILT